MTGVVAIMTRVYYEYSTVPYLTSMQRQSAPAPPPLQAGGQLEARATTRTRTSTAEIQYAAFTEPHTPAPSPRLKDWRHPQATAYKIAKTYKIAENVPTPLTILARDGRRTIIMTSGILDAEAAFRTTCPTHSWSRMRCALSDTVQYTSKQDKGDICRRERSKRCVALIGKNLYSLAFGFSCNLVARCLGRRHTTR